MPLELLTPKEMAEWFRSSERTLERKRRDGTGPPFLKFGSKVLYPLDGAEQFVCENTVLSTAEAQAED